MSDVHPPPRGRSFAELIGMLAIGASVAAAVCCVAFYLYISSLWEKYDSSKIPIPTGFPTSLPSAIPSVIPSITQGIPTAIPRVLDPWSLQPLPDLGPNPVTASATDVESLRTQQPILDQAPECEGANIEDLVETAKGQFLVNLESHIKKATALSDAQEMEIGKCMWEASRPLLEKKFKGAILDSGPEVDYIRGVIAPLLKGVSRKGIEYTVHYSTSPVWNAFATTGGHICVNKGFLDACRSEAEVAGVLGHEIMHVDRRHCLARIQYALTAMKVLRGDEDSKEICRQLNNPSANMVQIVINVGQMFYNSAQETEADLAGLEMMVRSGYSPFAVARLWRDKAAELGPKAPRKSGGLAFDILNKVVGVAQSALSSHPQCRLRFCLARKAGFKYLEADPDRQMYVGARNLTDRVPMTQRQF